MIRIPGTLKAKLLEKSNQENITLAGTARNLIEAGLASGPKIEEMEKQYDQLLEAFVYVAQVAVEKLSMVDEFEKRITALESETEAAK